MVAVGRPVHPAADSPVSAVVAEVSVAAAPVPAGDEMRTHRFLSHLDHDRIAKAIKEAEARTSGQIRVYIQRGQLEGDALLLAQKKFQKVGMDKTRERNAVLIFVAPRARKFAVIGDSGVHEKCGDQFWQRLVDSMRAHFKNEKFSQAIVEAVEETGKLLAQHFPKKATGTNELPDSIIET